MVRTLEDNRKYIIATIFMLFFVLNDLIFDFLFNFEASDYISFVCTLIAAFITFIGTYKVQQTNIAQKFDKTSIFIRSNFDNCQVIFSILDIFCGLISICSGLLFLGGCLKLVKIIYIPIKFVVVANKGKTIAKSITKFSLIWTVGRMFTRKKENFMKTWIKNNKMTLAYCIVLGALAGYCGYALPQAYLHTPVWANVIFAVLAFALACVFTILLGGDKVKQAVYRALSKALNNDNYEKVTTYANQLLETQAIHDEAVAQIEAEKKAEEKAAKEAEKAAKKAEEQSKNAEDEQAKAERQALVDAEKAKIKSESETK